MQIFGVGPLELLLILVLALVIMGPQDMVGTARKLGGWIYRVVRSPTWRAIINTSQDLRDLPNKIVREAGLEDAIKEIKQTANEVKSEMDATTREINTEMQSASSEINREMQTAAREVNTDLQTIAAARSAPDAGPTAEAAPAAAEGSSIAGDSEPLTETALAVSQAELAELAAGASPVPAAGDPLTAESSPESILWPETALSPAIETAPQAAFPSQDPPGHEQENPDQPALDPYVAGLETFARALGQSTKSGAGIEQNAASAIPQTITPEMIASAPPESPPSPGCEALPSNGGSPVTAVEESQPWATGLTVGSSVESDMQTRFQEQMAKMMKSFEELDAKIISPPADPAISEELTQGPPAENSPG